MLFKVLCHISSKLVFRFCQYIIFNNLDERIGGMISKFTNVNTITIVGSEEGCLRLLINWESGKGMVHGIEPKLV